MPEYQWALSNGDIVSADYNRANDSLSNEQVLAELQTAFQQFVILPIANPSTNSFLKSTLFLLKMHRKVTSQFAPKAQLLAGALI